MPVLPSLFRVVVPVADGGDVSATPTGVADVCIAPTGGICVAPTGGDGRAVPTVVHPSSFRVVVPVAVSGSAVVPFPFYFCVVVLIVILIGST